MCRTLPDFNWHARVARSLSDSWASCLLSQTAGYITMPLGMEVGLSPGHSVFDGDPAPSPKRWRSLLANFRPMSIVAKRLDGSRWHRTWHGGGPWFRPHCARWEPAPLPKNGAEPPPPQLSVHFYSAPQCSHCKRCTSYSNSVCLSVRHTPVLRQNDGT